MEKNIRYVIFGGGLAGKTFYEKMHDKISIVGFSDNNPAFWGINIGFKQSSVPCVPPKDIEQGVKVIVAAAPVYYAEISKQLQDLQLECVSAERFVYEYFTDTIRYVEECLADDESRRIYRQILECRMNNDFSAIKLIRSPEQYFAIPEFADYLGRGGEIFIDAGSYCGDILDTYINSRLGLFKKIYAFEPGRKQFRALQCRAERLRREWALEEDQIICVNGAVSDYNGTCNFEIDHGNITTSRMGMKESSSESIPVYKLDDFLKDGVDFIKADIEGQELAMLRGGEQSDTEI